MCNQVSHIYCMWLIRAYYYALLMNADLDYNQIQNTQLMQAFKRIDFFLTLMMFQTHFFYFFQ